MIKKILSSWDLSPVLVSEDNFESELAKIERQVLTFVEKWSKNKNFLKDPVVLREALDDYEKLNYDTGTSGKVGYYYALATSLDQNNSKLKAKENKISELSAKLTNELRFFEHKLAKIPQFRQKEFLENPILSQYRHFLEGLFNEAKYLLSEKEENVLTYMMKPAMFNWEEMTERLLSKEKAKLTDEKGKTKEFTMPEISGLMESQNKKVREAAACAYNLILEKYVDVAESEINSILEAKKYSDVLRKSPRPDFLRLLGDDVDTAFVDILVSAVSSSNDISADYYKAKAREMGQEKLEYYERNVELGDVSKEYSFDESVRLVEETLAELDPDFAQIFKDFVERGRIDAFSKENKSDGGFFIKPYKAYPGYILLNHQNKLSDMKTLAHEMGHAIHYEYFSRYQNALNYDSSLAIAEMASTFMEDFVLDHLKKNLSENDRRLLAFSRVDSDIASVHRQIACYKFELALHENFRNQGYLSKEVIGEFFKHEMSAYLGNSVVMNPGTENWWIYWSHIRNFFYVYSYASGLLISKALQALVKKDKRNISIFKEILKKGSSEKPVDIFKSLDINLYDANFWNSGLNQIRSAIADLQTH